MATNFFLLVLHLYIIDIEIFYLTKCVFSEVSYTIFSLKGKSKSLRPSTSSMLRGSQLSRSRRSLLRSTPHLSS